MTDAFELLGLEPRFDLDLSLLEQRHRELSLLLHPDRAAAKGGGERRVALSRAMTVNEAQRALKDPIRRAELLLARRGIRTGEGQEPAAEADLLMTMMEHREALRELGARRDGAGLSALAEQVERERAASEARLLAGFEAATTLPDALLRTLGELRYYRRFFDELSAIQDDLD